MAYSFEIYVDDPAAIVTSGSYEVIRVYRSTTGEGGTYTLLPTTATLDATKYLYTYFDATGKASYWYKTAYYSTNDDNEDEKSAAMLGGNRWYCKVAQLKARLNETGTADDPVFADAVMAATEEVRRYCRREFSQKTETRYFEGTGTRPPHTGKDPDILWLDDCVSLSDITLDFSGGASPTNTTTYTLGTHCYLWPQAAPKHDEPYFGLAYVASINMPQNTDWPLFSNLYWPSGYQSIRLTGVWGWPINPVTNSPVPAPVREATLQLAARIYKGRDNAYSRTVGNADLGTLQIKDDLFNADTRALLRPYIREIGH